MVTGEDTKGDGEVAGNLWVWTGAEGDREWVRKMEMLIGNTCWKEMLIAYFSSSPTQLSTDALTVSSQFSCKQRILLLSKLDFEVFHFYCFSRYTAFDHGSHVIGYLQIYILGR